MLRDPNVSGGVMPGRRAQRICQGGTSGPSGIAMRNVTERDKSRRTPPTLCGLTRDDTRPQLHAHGIQCTVTRVWIRNCQPHFVKSSRNDTNASGVYSSIDRKAPRALARSDSRSTSESTLSAGHPPTAHCRLPR